MYIIPFPFPLKAKWVVLGYGVFELFFGISGTMDNVAHFAHLGGMIAGIILILYWKHSGVIRRNGIY
jgi:membrane associated rhomboid family serine protease